MASMKARFPGICHQCHGRFETGDEILWIPGYVVHRRCPTPTAAEQVRQDRKDQTMADLIALKKGTIEAYRARDIPNLALAPCILCGCHLRPGTIVAEATTGEPGRIVCADCIFEIRVTTLEKEALDGDIPLDLIEFH